MNNCDQCATDLRPLMKIRRRFIYSEAKTGYTEMQI